MFASNNRQGQDFVLGTPHQRIKEELADAALRPAHVKVVLVRQGYSKHSTASVPFAHAWKILISNVYLVCHEAGQAIGGILIVHSYENRKVREKNGKDH